MSHDHWREYHTRWERLRPPLRPTPGVAAAIRSALGDRPGPVLLLGVTPELADVSSDVTAVDRSPGMIAAVWPGDTGRRRAVCADWRALPFETGRFAAIVGDGSLNTMTHPGEVIAFLVELARVLDPAGRLVLRVFERPDTGGSPADVVARARSGRIANFHAFKWELAMARIAELGTPNIPVQEILDTFEKHVEDRASLARDAGWATEDVDTIDVYRGSAEVYSFPSRAELEGAFGTAFGTPRFVAVPGYPLAERCPLVVADRRGV